MIFITKLQLVAVLYLLLLEGPDDVESFQQHFACSSFTCRTKIIRSVSLMSAEAKHYNLPKAISPRNIENTLKSGNKDFIDSIETTSRSSTEATINNNESIHRSEKSENKKKVTAVVTALLAACSAMIAFSGKGAWRYYLAGGICAAFSHAVTTPVDVIKTRKQVDETMKELSIIQSGLKIVKDEGGINALLAGLGPTTFGYLFEGAVKFGIYEVAKPIVRSMLAWSSALCSIPWMNSKLLGFIISGGIAGTAASIMLCPMEALRIRLVAEPEFAANGWVDCGINMVDNEGVKGLWKSFPAMLSKQVPYTITKNVSFDLVTTLAYATVAARGLTICGKTKVVIPLLSAMFASVLSCISSQPGDMLLTAVNAHEGKDRTVDFARSIMKENGLGGFFVGMRERFVHVSLIVTMQLSIYDFVKRLVGIAATGL